MDRNDRQRLVLDIITGKHISVGEQPISRDAPKIARFSLRLPHPAGFVYRIREKAYRFSPDTRKMHYV